MAIVIRRRNSSGVRTTTARFSSAMSAPLNTAISIASGRVCNRLFKTHEARVGAHLRRRHRH